jgi:hypothetical protein
VFQRKAIITKNPAIMIMTSGSISSHHSILLEYIQPLDIDRIIPGTENFTGIRHQTIIHFYFPLIGLATIGMVIDLDGTVISR